MGTQVLANSEGLYRNKYKFVVAQDTCMEAEKVPVFFVHEKAGKSAVSCLLKMEEISFINPKTADY